MDHTTTRILIVEDEHSHAEVIKRYLLAYSSAIEVAIAPSWS